MSLEFISDFIEVDGLRLYGYLSELENAVIALFWTGENPYLGSVSVSLPNRTSSQVLGNRDEFLGKMIGERLASKYMKLVLVSIYLPIGLNANKALFELAEKIAGGKRE
jgi:hypothetical protein